MNNHEIPARTAELAQRMRGVRILLENGVDVLHYEDRRDQEAARSQEYRVAETGRIATHRRIMRSMIETGEIDPFSKRMEP